MNLQSSITAMIIAACIFSASSGIYLYLKYQRNLSTFRANLRPGDLCRVRTSSGMRRARIMKRDTTQSYITLDIDLKRPLITPSTNIFQP